MAISSIPELYEVEWLLIVGGSEQQRKEKANRLHYEHWLKIEEQCNPTIQQIKMRTNLKHSTIDIAGYDEAMLRNLLLGNIKDLDISGNPFSWLSKTKGRLLNLYGLNGLVLNNLNFSRHADTIKLLRSILKMIKVSIENTTIPYGMFVITLEDKNDLKKLPEGFTDLFKILSLDIEVDYNKPSFTYMDKVTKSQYIRIKLFEFLRMNDGVTVTREEINICLWDVKVNDSDFDPKRQLDQHISGLRKDLEQLGIKNPGKVIETIGKTQLSVGGYKYHSELI